MLPPVAQTPADTDLDLRKLWGVIWRRRWLVVLVLVVSAGVGVAIIAWMAPRYQGMSSIRIDPVGTVAPVVDVLQTASPGTTEIATEQAILASRTLAEATMDSLQLQVQLTSPRHVSRTEVLSDIHVTSPTTNGRYAITHDAEGQFHLRDLNADTVINAPVPAGVPVVLPGVTFRVTNAASKYAELRIGVQPRARVVSTMMTSTLVIARPDKNANVLTATYTSPDSVLARDVPNVLAALFITSRQRAMQTQAQNAVHVLRGQLDTTARHLRAAEAALQSFRERAQFYEPSTQGASEAGYVVKLAAQRNTLDAERSALAKVMAGIHAEQAQPNPDSASSPYRRLLGFPPIMATPSGGQLLNALATVENQRAALLMRRRSADPDVQTLDARVHDLERQIENLGTTYAQSLEQQEQTIDSTLTSYTAVLATIPAKEIAYARLVRQASVYDDIDTLLQTKLQESEIAASVTDGSARVVDYAAFNDAPVSPNVPVIAAATAILGLILAVIVVFVREFFDRGVHTKDELASLTGVPVLGLIPHIRSPRAAPLDTRLVSRKDPRNPGAEAFRTLRTNMTLAEEDRSARTLVMASPMPGDGRSTTATNLAITLAQQGLRVLLVDADLRRGALHELLRVPRAPGFSDALTGEGTPEPAIHAIDIGLANGRGGLHLLATGTLPANPAELLASARCRSMVETLSAEYDMVLFDTPPMNLVTDAVVLASTAAAVVVVARAGSTMPEALAYS
ncbi:MAG: GumC family protein, partial [Gemmatimonadaceae bacterium]